MDGNGRKFREQIRLSAIKSVAEQREARKNGESASVARPISKMDQFFAKRREKEENSVNLSQMDDQQSKDQEMARENGQSTQGRAMSRMDLFFINRKREEKEREEQNARMQANGVGGQQANSVQKVKFSSPIVSTHSISNEYSEDIASSVTNVQLTTGTQSTSSGCPIKSILKVKKTSFSLATHSKDQSEATAPSVSESVQSAVNDQLPTSDDSFEDKLEQELCTRPEEKKAIIQEEFETWYYPPAGFPKQDPNKLDLIELFCSYECSEWPEHMKGQEKEEEENDFYPI